MTSHRSTRLGRAWLGSVPVGGWIERWIISYARVSPRRQVRQRHKTTYVVIIRHMLNTLAYVAYVLLVLPMCAYANVGARRQRGRGNWMIRIVAIANAKGGTAKTTTAVALAAEAAHRGFKSLLIDLDVQANSTEQLLRDGESDAGKAFNRTVIDADPLDVHASSTDNLDVAPAGRRTQDLSDSLTRLVREAAPEDLGMAYKTMRQNLHHACSDYDWVFIDTPPSEQSATLLDFVYAASTHAVFPTKIDRNSTDAVSSALRQLVRLAKRGAEVADPVGILLVDVDTAATRLVAGALESVRDIGGVVEPFTTLISHRSGPVAYARSERMTPRQFAAAAEQAHHQRFESLRAGTLQENPPWSASSAAKLVADYSDLFDELVERVNRS